MSYNFAGIALGYSKYCCYHVGSACDQVETHMFIRVSPEYDGPDHCTAFNLVKVDHVIHPIPSVKVRLLLFRRSTSSSYKWRCSVGSRPYTPDSVVVHMCKVGSER